MMSALTLSISKEKGESFNYYKLYLYFLWEKLIKVNFLIGFLRVGRIKFLKNNLGLVKNFKIINYYKKKSL